jgi:divalent metal cation (Fe/Co/Zn/Cd) transporter
VHVEISEQMNLIEAHHEIDLLEQKILSEMGIDIVIHVDPVSNSGMSPIL